MTGFCNILSVDATHVSENTPAFKRKKQLLLIIIKTVLVKWMMYKHPSVNSYSGLCVY
jgi:hypothetical protein